MEVRRPRKVPQMSMPEKQPPRESGVLDQGPKKKAAVVCLASIRAQTLPVTLNRGCKRGERASKSVDRGLTVTRRSTILIQDQQARGSGSGWVRETKR